jgi:hypothetical protein
MQVQAYRLAIEQHRNFQLRVPVNINTAQFTQHDSGAAAPGSAAQQPPDPARRRSLGGGMRYIRFQFRSVSSVASHMAPAAVSVPPVLMSSADGPTCYYWATVDLPGPGSLRDEQGLADGSMQVQRSGSAGLGGSAGSGAVAARRSHGVSSCYFGGGTA